MFFFFFGHKSDQYVKKFIYLFFIKYFILRHFKIEHRTIHLRLGGITFFDEQLGSITVTNKMYKI